MEPIQALLYILYGVSYLNTTGPQPSPLLVEGNAFGVLKNSNNDFIIAAAHLNQGKIVTVSHEGLVNGQPMGDDDSYLLGPNIFQWLTIESEDTPKVGFLVNGYDNLISNLEEVNFTVSQISLTFAELASVDAVFTTIYSHYSDTELASLQQFVSNGGGLLLAGSNYLEYSDQILMNSGISYASTSGIYTYKVPDPDHQPQVFMLHNVLTINSKGDKASRLLISGNAFSILKTAGGKITVAGAPLSQGRIVAVGHESYVMFRGPSGPNNPESSYIFTRNIVSWLAKCNETAVLGVIPNNYESVSGYLASDGFTVTQISATEEDLSTVDVVLAIVYTRYTAEQRDAIHSFVTNGGGLLLAGHNWYYKTTYVNDLLFDSGITITSSSSDSRGTTYKILPDPPSSITNYCP